MKKAYIISGLLSLALFIVGIVALIPFSSNQTYAQGNYSPLSSELSVKTIMVVDGDTVAVASFGDEWHALFNTDFSTTTTLALQPQDLQGGRTELALSNF